MTTPNSNERREYYRIADQAALQILPPSALDAPASSRQEELFRLYQLELESLALLRQIDTTMTPLANYLQVLEQRLGILTHMLLEETLPDLGPAQPVMLSEGGIDFTSPDPQAPGTPIHLRLLLGSGLLLQVPARVQRCEPAASGGYEVATAFTGLDETRRQLLARYILQQQARKRREARAETPR